MSLVVGHNCPGCGLDTPQVACEECGAPVVWNPEDGSHCSACGLSAAAITCPECGLRAVLDKRPDEYRSRPVAPRVALAESDNDEDDDGEEEEEEAPPRQRRLLAWAGTTLASPAVRTLAIVLAVAVPASVVAPLLAARDQPGQAGGNIGIAARAPRDVTVVGGVLPVPVQPPPPRPVEDLLPPKPAIATTWQDDRPAPVSRPAPPPRREGWLQRMLKSGSVTSTGPRFEPIHGDGGGAGSGGGGGSGR